MVLATREPGGTEIGAHLRRILLYETDATRQLSPLSEALLFSLDRVEHLQQIVRPALRAGKHVLCDRFADSTLAYQGQAAPRQRETIEALNRMVVGETWPDVTFILDVPASVSLARARRRGDVESCFEKRDITFHEGLRQAFLQIATNNPHRCVVVDAGESVENIARQIEEICRRRLGLFP